MFDKIRHNIRALLMLHTGQIKMFPPEHLAIADKKHLYNRLVTRCCKGYNIAVAALVDEPFPRVLYARRQKKDKSKYFGPFTNAYAVKETLELLRKTYQYRNCNKQLTGKKTLCCISGGAP